MSQSTPDAVSALLDLGLEHHRAGRAWEAEQAYRAVLAQSPHEPEALSLLGLLLQDRGELAASIAMLRQALEADPDFPEALVNLARGLRASGAAAEAAASARRAVELAPDLADAHLILGRALLDLGENVAATKACRAAVRLDPVLRDAQATLGVALNRQLDHAGAVIAFLAAIELAPDDAAVATALGVALSEMNEHEKAIAWLGRAIGLAPHEVGGHVALAVAKARSHDTAGAMQACRDALALAPERADLWTMLGGHAAALGHFEEASGYHRRALDIDPNCTEARRELVSIRQGEQTAEERAALSAVLADSSRAVRDRIAAGFALGAEYERAGDIDRAFGAFADANRLARAEAVAAGKGFDAAAMRGSVDWLVRTFGPAAFARTIGWGDPAEVPVFVVGMPRSGTTLVEQIASSHTQVFGAGERMDIPRIIDVLMGGDSSRTPDRWDPVAVRREALAYVERLRKLDGAALRVIDKLPDNIQSLGQIAILFPRARVIICRRDLRDVCLSCHTQRFADSLPWTHDLADCAVRAREIERLVAHWTAVLPLRMLEVGYETLVGDLEGESRRIIDFLGLPWDPACLAFHRTERSVLTASRWQVRQPLYSSSVGRWRMYRRHLGPLLAGLKGLVAEDD